MVVPTTTQAGRFAKQPQGYEAFVPEPLPPDPAVEIDGEMLAVLSAADQALGRLDGVIQTVPNPDLFVAMYVRREAVLSSQIEGTQSTLDDLLAADLEPAAAGLPDDVEEVVNYVRAMNYGLERLSSLPLSTRLIPRSTRSCCGPVGALCALRASSDEIRTGSVRRMPRSSRPPSFLHLCGKCMRRSETSSASSTRRTSCQS